MKLVSKQYAKENNLGRYFTGTPCKFGHISERYASSGACVQCRKEKDALIYSDKEFVAKRNRESYERNKPTVLAKAKVRYVSKAEEINFKNTRRRQFRLEEYRARDREYGKTHRAKKYAHNSKRRKGVELATPKWADLGKIASIYKYSETVSETTGVKHNVDHIIPLKHKLVCGLNIPSNMRVITAKDNFQKGNRFSQEEYEQILRETSNTA